MNQILNRILYFLSLLPWSILYTLSNFIFFLVYYIIRYRRKIVLTNIENSFPSKNKKEIKKIERDFYKQFCDNIVEILKLLSIKPKNLLKRVQFKNLEKFDELYLNNKHVFAVLGHLGNWEWINSAICQSIKHQTLVIYRPLKNKQNDQLIYNLRTRFGSEAVAQNNFFRVLSEKKKNNTPTATGVLADQSPMRKDIHYWTHFLNQETPVFTGFEKIARKLDIAIVYLKLTKIKRGHYQIEIVPMFDNTADLKDYEIAESFMRELEKNILTNPSLYLWTHKRWKHKKLINEAV